MLLHADQMIVKVFMRLIGKESLIFLINVNKRGVKRIIFLSILLTEEFRNVPLMDVKFCTEKLLEKSEFNYTIFKCAAFMQGVIGQFAIPILDSQAVWMSGAPTKIAYINTQDMANIIVSSIDNSNTFRLSLPLVGPKAWNPNEIISLCEKYSLSLIHI